MFSTTSQILISPPPPPPSNLINWNSMIFCIVLTIRFHLSKYGMTFCIVLYRVLYNMQVWHFALCCIRFHICQYDILYCVVSGFHICKYDILHCAVSGFTYASMTFCNVLYQVSHMQVWHFVLCCIRFQVCKYDILYWAVSGFTYKVWHFV